MRKVVIHTDKVPPAECSRLVADARVEIEAIALVE